MLNESGDGSKETSQEVLAAAQTKGDGSLVDGSHGGGIYRCRDVEESHDIFCSK